MIREARLKSFPKLMIYVLFSFSIQMVPQTVIYFTAYDQLKVRFGHVEGQTGFGAPMLAGVTSRCMSFS